MQQQEQQQQQHILVSLFNLLYKKFMKEQKKNYQQTD